MMRIRQSALDYGRKTGIRYVFFIDTDIFLTNPSTLRHLISLQKTVVAPLIKINSNFAYSNFWAGKTHSPFYPF
jgi:hypothetical protein